MDIYAFSVKSLEGVNEVKSNIIKSKKLFVLN